MAPRSKGSFSSIRLVEPARLAIGSDQLTFRYSPVTLLGVAQRVQRTFSSITYSSLGSGVSQNGCLSR